VSGLTMASTLSALLIYLNRTKRYSSATGPLGYYIDPSLDGERPGRFYANVFKPETK
jgi:uncharacterized protein (DUF885 family)